MSSTQTSLTFPAAATTVTGSGTAWVNPGNVSIADGNNATLTLAANGNSSNALVANYYHFAIPLNATILGIQVTVFCVSTAKNSSLLLHKDIGNNTDGTVGTDKATGAVWPGSSGANAAVTYGGATDLWGTTWTASDINNNLFGVGIVMQATAASQTAQIDYVAVTVYYQTNVADVPKRYTVKVYDNATNEYLGNLPETSSVFSLSQDINTAGGQIVLNVPLSIDIAAQASVGILQDESGNALLDEAGNALLTEGAVPDVALGNGTGLIKNGNKIVVYEQSYYAPNGRVIFKGVMERWQAVIGGDNNSDSITITAYSDGSDLDNYLLYNLPYTYTLDNSQTTYDTSYDSYNDTATGTYFIQGQQFTIGSATNIGGISLLLRGTAHVTVKVYQLSTNIVVGSNRQFVDVAAITEVRITIGNRIPAVTGQTYYFTVEVDAGERITVFYNSTNIYSGGAQMTKEFNGFGTPPTGFTVTTADMWFKTWSTTVTTTAQFNSLDPSTMLKNFMDDYSGRGGKIAYTTASIDMTGLTLSYGMITNSIYEGIQKMLSLAPDGFYYYVDMATNTLYFKNANTGADFTLTRGSQINSLDLTFSIEQVKNQIYFSGGVPAGGTNNLYKYDEDATSISLYGARLIRKSDNRVTLDTTATAIVNSAIATQKDETAETTIVVTDKTLDTMAIHVGQTLSFRGYGSFIDSLILQVVRKDYGPEQTSLTVGVLPVRLDAELERINRELIAEQTLDNPTTPS